MSSRLRLVPYLLIAIGLSMLFLVAGPSQALAADGDTYFVQAGDTLASIAEAHGLSVAELVEFNKLPSADFIWVGQTLQLTAQPAAPAVSPSHPTTVFAGTYTVEAGDTLASIAEALGILESTLTQANGIVDPDSIYVGQELEIPGPPSPDSLPSLEAPETYYVIQRGDTLGAIARQFNTSAATLARANDLSSPDVLRIGMELLIPGGERGIPGYPTGEYRFVASISQQQCWVYNQGAVIYDWVCSTGRSGAPTVAGSYFVQTKLDRAWGSAWSFWMPYWLGIYYAGDSENGIHGLPYDPYGGWKMWEGLVGTRITFGCILLDDDNAATLFDLAYIGMPVTILN